MFRVTVKDKNNEWTEDYPNFSLKSGRGWDVENQYEAEEVGKSFITKFNSTLRPGENPREFVKAEYFGEDETVDNP